MKPEDVNQLAKYAAPWTFVATVDGVQYPTRAPTIVELVKLENISPDRHGEIRVLTARLFIGPDKPNFLRLGEFALLNFLVAYTGYANDWQSTFRFPLSVRRFVQKAFKKGGF